MAVRPLRAPSSQHPILVAALLIAAAVAAYWPALTGGFVMDDDALVAGSRLVTSSDGLARIWFSTEPLDYWPITNSSFWLEWRLWGANTTGYHVTNVVLHAASAFLIWRLLRRLSIPGALLAAFLFLLHPVNVESVAWIAQRKNTLSMFFALLALLWYPIDERDQPGRRYWWSFAAFVVAMLSKGSVVMLPLILMLLIWWRRGAVAPGDVRRLAPFLVVGAGLTLVNIWFQGHYMTGEAIRPDTALQRILGAGGVVWFYLYKALWPTGLAFVYPQWTVGVDDVRWWVPLAAAVAVTVGLWWRRRSPVTDALFTAWGTFCLALVPVMGFVDVYFMKYSLVGDHYQYVALGAVVTIVAAGLYRAAGAQPIRAVVTGTALAVVLGGLTWQQSRQYANAETLYRATIDRNPVAWVAHANLALLLIQGTETQTAEAVTLLERAVSLNPREPRLQANLGTALQRLGRHEEAVARYRSALRLAPDVGDLHAALVSQLLALGRTDEAAVELRLAAAAGTARAEDHGAMGDALLRLGRPSDAVAEYRAAVALSPTSAQLLNNLGFALAAAGRLAEAEAQLRRAIALNPADAATHDNLGNVLAGLNRLPEAVQAFERALQVAGPADLPAVHNDYAIALARMGRRDEAIAHLREALRINPNYGPARKNLAGAGR